MEDCLVITRLSDQYTRRIPLKDQGIVKISRSFVQDGRKHRKSDKYVTRKTHAILLRRGHEIHVYNQHENEVVVLGPIIHVVPKGCWKRVDGRILSVCGYEPDRPSDTSLEFHVELEGKDVRESPPPTPLL